MTSAQARLLDLLDEQLMFIDASCGAFDLGHERECKRLATHVRILMHDTRRSTSLLTWLGVKELLWFFDPLVEKREHVAEMLARGGVPLFAGGLTVVRMGDGGTRYVARSLSEPRIGPRMSRFEEWWRAEALLTQSGPPPSRWNIVDWLAHKDGGAHVDDLPPDYTALVSGVAMGVTFPNASPTQNSPVPAAMRQIAEEVRLSLRDQRELIEVASAAL